MTLPTLQALLLADHVYRDADTQKHIICGVFGQVYFTTTKNTATKPGSNTDEGDAEVEGAAKEITAPMESVRRAGSPYAYISLTEVHGTKRFELRYIDLQDFSVLLKAEFDVHCENPLLNVQLVMPLPHLPTPHPGTFVLELLCENTMLGSHRVLATLDPNEQ